MTTTLITGGNGYDTARRLVVTGHTVYLGARDPDAGRRGAGQPVEDGSAALVPLATEGHDGRGGTLLDRHGQLPW